MQQSLTLVSAILLGLLFPQISSLSFLIAPILGTMLFFTFLKNHLPLKIFGEWRLYALFAINVSMGFLAYFVAKPFLGEQMAFMLFLVGITPTALAAPAVMSILQKRVDFVIASVFLTNFGITILYPFFFSFVTPLQFSVQTMLSKIFVLLFVPFFIAKAIEFFVPNLKKKLLHFPHLSFYLWAGIIILSVSSISAFMRENWAEYSSFVLPIAFSTAIICILNFSIGYFLGGKKWKEECSQCLGQKNLQIPIWISISFFSPIYGLAAAFYIVFHNLANSWKIWQFHAKKSLTPTLSLMERENIFLCDNDSSFMKEESLDEIAKFVSPELFEKISAFTDAQMNGEEKMLFRQSLEKRVQMLLDELQNVEKKMTREDLKKIAENQLHFSDGAEEFLQKIIAKHGTLKGKFFIVSGGFVEIIAPKIEELNISIPEKKILQSQIVANCFAWDKNGFLTGVDWQNSKVWEENAKGKIASSLTLTLSLREREYFRIIGIGDGSNDMAFAQSDGMFVAFVGNIFREKVAQKADKTIKNFLELKELL